MRYILAIGTERWLLWFFGGIVAGYVYNYVTTRQLEKWPFVPPSVMVVGGTVLTIALSALVIPVPYAILTGLTFAWTGSPMIVGDLKRFCEYIQRKLKKAHERGGQVARGD